MRLKLQKRSLLELASRIIQRSREMRLKLQKRSVLKLASRINETQILQT
jgi:hypothetical protein